MWPTKTANKALRKTIEIEERLRTYQKVVAKIEEKHIATHSRFEEVLVNVTLDFGEILNLTDNRIHLDRRASIMYDMLTRTDTRLTNLFDSWDHGKVHSDLFRLFPTLH